MQNTNLIEKIQKLPPETVVEVEHFVDFLTERRKVSAKQKRCEELRAFAQKYGGTEMDLDEELEAAAVKYLLETTE